MIVPHRLFVTLSLVMGSVAFASYVRSIVKGQARPHMFSWLIWGLSTAICCAVQFADHGGVGSWYMGVNSLYCFGLAFASLWIGTKDVRRIDWLVLIVTLAALPLWWITKSPLWSIVLVTLIDGLGYVPTVRKSWTRPYEESALSWGLSCVVFSCSILALENYSVANCLYPATFVVVNFGFVLFLLIRRKIAADLQ